MHYLISLSRLFNVMSCQNNGGLFPIVTGNVDKMVPDSEILNIL